MGLWSDLIGSTLGYFKLGIGGVRLKNSSGALAIRNSADTDNAGIVGVATNSNAAVGQIGEYIFSDIPNTSAVALVNNIVKTVTSIILTAGDWDVTGSVGFTGNAATVAYNTLSSISTIDNTIDVTGGRYVITVPVSTSFAIQNRFIIPITHSRFNLAATTTIYLVAQLGFTTNVAAGFGIIQARRMR